MALGNNNYGLFYEEIHQNWCPFCQGDSSILFCMYCSCIACHGKYDPNTVLLCDSCDSECHMGCLDPPLVAVPKGEWYCQRCVAEGKDHKNEKIIQFSNYYNYEQGNAKKERRCSQVR
mmetsp:Transcript_17228/g.24388  ORF Transcript_17228/g.24388 Transcript_17228/m.24388 type:complete len:118 (-) Transcript_17228:660-1013(-)